MRALLCESDDPGAEDALELECIATAIALALSQQSKATTLSAKTEPRLAPRQVRAVQAHVEDHLPETLTLARMASVVGLSEFHFLRAFKGSLGVTPGQYVLDRRMARAKVLLESTSLCVAAVGMRVGFSHASHFSRAFRKAMGVTPTAMREALQK